MTVIYCELDCEIVDEILYPILTLYYVNYN